MPDTFEVTIAYEPFLDIRLGSSSANVLGNGLVYHLPSSDTSIKVRDEVVSTPMPDGTMGTGENIRQLIIELDADSAEAAKDRSVAIAVQFCRLTALVHHTGITLGSRIPYARNLSRPNSDSATVGAVSVGISGYHPSPEKVEKVWQLFEMLSDADIRDAVELGLEWVYIARGTRDDRSAFVANWTALELMLDLIPPLSGPSKSLTILNKYVPPDQHDVALKAVSESLAPWIPDTSARERIVAAVREAKVESDVSRWAQTLAERGVTGMDGVPLTPKLLRGWQQMRHTLVHRGGAPTNKERKKGQKGFLTEVPLSEIDWIVRRLIICLLAGIPSSNQP